MSVVQQIRYIIVPHIAKSIYPALANFFIVVLVMGTSIGAVIGVDELTGEAINLSTVNYRWLEYFSVIAVMYVVLTFIASHRARACSGRWAFRVKAQDLLMERILEQMPRFFAPGNLWLLVEAAGFTLAMTLVGCTDRLLPGLPAGLPAPDAGPLGAAAAAWSASPMSRSSAASRSSW